MIKEMKNIHGSSKELKKFGWTLGIIFFLLGAGFFLRRKEIYSYFFIASVSFGFLTLVYKKGLKFIYIPWMIIAIIIGWVMTRVILSLLFFLIATPIGLLGRLFGEEFLDLKPKGNGDTYWVRRPRRTFSKEQYKKQF